MTKLDVRLKINARDAWTYTFGVDTVLRRSISCKVAIVYDKQANGLLPAGVGSTSLQNIDMIWQGCDFSGGVSSHTYGPVNAPTPCDPFQNMNLADRFMILHEQNIEIHPPYVYIVGAAMAPFTKQEAEPKNIDFSLDLEHDICFLTTAATDIQAIAGGALYFMATADNAGGAGESWCAIKGNIRVHYRDE